MSRLDIELVQRKICKTRSQALLFVKESNVLLNGVVCTKPNKEIKETDVLSLIAEPRFVSRGGDKLAYALDTFKITFQAGSVGLDIGSSTGGFTDCLLQAGVERVYAVDVGSGQFDEELQKDKRVVLMQKTDIRSLKSLPERADIIVVDVSFISLIHIIPIIKHFIVRGGRVAFLVKPQFEVGKGNVNRQGLVTRPELYIEVLEKIQNSCKENSLHVEGYMQSPVLGGTGNTEFLLYAKHIV
jgi:23S rRNA (cytidine1920-2'-O)/16S rRNA (cytidine1409-2'-O)-methyltransferase